MQNGITILQISHMQHFQLICSKYTALCCKCCSYFLNNFSRVSTSNYTFMQRFMQVYEEYPDLGSMLQLGYCAAFMQHYAATCSFFVKTTFLILPNTKILLYYKRLWTTKPPFTNYMICCIFNWYAVSVQQYAAGIAAILFNNFF